MPRTARIRAARPISASTPKLADLTLIDPRLAGARHRDRTRHRPDRRDRPQLPGRDPEGRLLDRPIDPAALGFTGSLAGTDMTGAWKAAAASGASRSRCGRDRLEGRTRSGARAEGRGRRQSDRGRVRPDGDRPRLRHAVAARARHRTARRARLWSRPRGAIQADLTLQPDETRQNVSPMPRVRGSPSAPTGSARSPSPPISRTLKVDHQWHAVGRRYMAVGPLNIATLSARADQIDRIRMNFTASTKFAVGTEIDAGRCAAAARTRLRAQPGEPLAAPGPAPPP